MIRVEKGKSGVNKAYLRPAMSMNLIAMAMLGSIKRFVSPLIRKDAELEVRPRFERRTSTPAC